MLRKGLGLTLVAAALVAGCFTGPVNMTPSIRIVVSPSGPIFRGQSLTYSAVISDPDNGGDTPRIEWAWVRGTCPPNFLDSATWPPNKADWTLGPTLMGPADARGPSCVWAKVTDKSGAVAVDAVPCDPGDHAPVVDVQVSPDAPDAGTYLPSTQFQFSAAGSTDPDPGDQAHLSVSWSIARGPDGGVLGPCMGDPDPFKQCLTAGAVGTYVVAAIVSDAVDGGADGSFSTSTGSATVVVAPGPPPVAEISIESFTPPLESDDGHYALGASFRLSSVTSHRADGSHDVAPRWISIRSPDGAQTDLRDPASLSEYSCGPDAPTTIVCFTAEKPGTYHVELAVDDGFSTSAIVGRDFQIASDQPPCIRDLSLVPPKNPETIIPLQGNQISVFKVDDDRDPFPGFNAIAWFIEQPSGNGGAPTFAFRGEFETYPLKDEGRPGDVVKVRLEVHDRNSDASNQDFVACGGAPTCSLPNLFFRSCVQRMTFNVQLSGQ